MEAFCYRPSEITEKDSLVFTSKSFLFRKIQKINNVNCPVLLTDICCKKVLILLNSLSTKSFMKVMYSSFPPNLKEHGTVSNTCNYNDMTKLQLKPSFHG